MGQITKPSIPKGTRDFAPLQMARRNYIFDTIRSVFRLYGFEQIETPAMENLSTLMGKYGEEGDKLLFKVLNSGDWRAGLYPSGASATPAALGEELMSASIGALTSKVSEKGLRYDLTVPFARFVTQYRNDIAFPFKRYQIQPVWRADRPQKGRYREFYQCDVDVVGTDSLVSELELIQIVEEVYKRLGIRVCLKLNNRKILSGIAEVVGAADKIVDITVAIDKLDKIGLEKVNEELKERGLSDEQVEKLQPILNGAVSYPSGQKGSSQVAATIGVHRTPDAPKLGEELNQVKLASLREMLKDSEVGLKGVAETEEIFALCEAAGVGLNVELDLTLARGLNYYTGAIFEVKALDVQMGSITGGGRYDNLTGIFGMPGVSGVGISFGADRIYDVLTELDLYPQAVLEQTQLLFVTFGQDELRYALRWAKALRAEGVRVEVYPEPTKMKKQMGYADTKKIPFVAIVGGDEMAQGKVMLKDMVTGEQKLVTLEALQAQFVNL